MLRYLFLFLIFLHGSIHLLGFVKAWGPAAVPQLTGEMSRTSGLAWLGAALLLGTLGILYWTGSAFWTWLAGLAVLVSQVLIFTQWQDAKFGTLANVALLAVALFGYAESRFENRFSTDVRQARERTQNLTPAILTEQDLAPLPEPVRAYLRYAGVVGKPFVQNMKVSMSGEMRAKDKDWFPFTSVQYNFFNEPTRLFLMKARLLGLPVAGYHSYKDSTAGMLVKALSVFPVARHSGPDLFRAETVTLFNDMCLMAPASLVDPGITWEPVDSLSAKATFTNRGIRISAVLLFNDTGQLINFISDDRLDVNTGKVIRFSTPVHGYKMIHGYRLFSDGDAVWHYPDGDFVYGKFHLQDVRYNTE